MTLLECTDLVKTFDIDPSQRRVLDGIDLAVRRGEFLVVMGASGSGKSTLLHCLSGMDRPTAGTVRLLDRELTALTSREMSRARLEHMGFVFQQPHFLSSLSIRDNALLPVLRLTERQGADARAQGAARVDELLARFDIAQVAHHAPSQASGGQLQRASIVRALACEPEVVFADEPTGALNSRMGAEVMDALSDAQCSGTTIIMVTHDPRSAARGDRVVYLRDGRLLDARDMGRWTAAEAPVREASLLTWLQGLGF